MKFTEAELNLGKFRSSDLIVDLESGLLEKEGETLVLPDLTWKAFCCLIRQQGAVVSVDQVIQSVWGDVAVSNETVSQRIKLLRRELGDSVHEPQYIETIRNRGFRWIPELEKVDFVSTQRNFKPLKVVGIILLLMLFVGWLGQEYFRPSQTPSNEVVDRGFEYLSRLNREDNQIAMNLFEAALAKKPQDYAALIGLSFAKTHNASKFNFPMSVAVEGEEIANRALQVSATAEGYHALAFSQDAQGRITEAIESYEKALELAPNSASILGSAAYLYQVRGNLARALEYGLASHELDSTVPFSEVQIASTYHLLEQDELAHHWLSRGILLKPDNVFIHSVSAEIGFALGSRKDVEEALGRAKSMGIQRPELHLVTGLNAVSDHDMELAKKSFALADANSGGRQSGAAYLIWLRILEGDQEAIKSAGEWLDSQTESEDPEHHLLRAGLILSMGRKLESLRSLDAAIEAGFRDWRFLNKHPMFLPFKGNEDYLQRLDTMRHLVATELRSLGIEPQS